MPGDPDTNLLAVHHVVLSLDGPFGLGSGASGEKSSIRMYFLTVLRSHGREPENLPVSDHAFSFLGSGATSSSLGESLRLPCRCSTTASWNGVPVVRGIMHAGACCTQ